MHKKLAGEGGRGERRESERDGEVRGGEEGGEREEEGEG